MAHDPISAMQRKTYQDSLLLPLPSINGTIIGKNIPTKPGYYTYGGNIQREGAIIRINIFYDNIDDKRADYSEWNGNYKLVSR